MSTNTSVDCDFNAIVKYYLKTFVLEYNIDLPFPTYVPDIEGSTVSTNIFTHIQTAISNLCSSTSEDESLKLRCIEFVTIMSTRPENINLMAYFNSMAYDLDSQITSALSTVMLLLDMYSTSSQPISSRSEEQVRTNIRKLNDEFELYRIILNFLVDMFRSNKSINSMVATNDKLFIYTEYINRLSKTLRQLNDILSGSKSCRTLILSKELQSLGKDIHTLIEQDYNKLGKISVKASFSSL